jgi:multicomponent Na+:H+ antiporter subunit G
MILDEILIFSGAAFILISAIGVLRFGDPLSRMHATTKASSFGILLIIIGVCLSFDHCWYMSRLCLSLSLFTMTARWQLMPSPVPYTLKREKTRKRGLSRPVCEKA